MLSSIGCFLYFAAVSAYMVLAGRFMQGIEYCTSHDTYVAIAYINFTLSCNCPKGLSLAGGTIINGEIARITTRKERTAVYTLLTGVTQFGYVIGIQIRLATLLHLSWQYNYV